MNTLLRAGAFLLALTFAHAALAGQDPLLTALEESKTSGKGLSFFVNGHTVAGVVVSVDDRYVVARSQAQGTIVIRLDELDGVAGFVVQPLGERKAQ